ncbi:MAG: thioesterase [Treponema sp.]|nr:thioesterase [Treponema sp.]
MMCDAANPQAAGPVPVWQETFPVRFGSIDRSDRLTISAMFQFFQEAAISHAANLGLGREDMAAARRLWILSRMSVQVDRRPGYCENITVRSWPRGGEKLFAMRDYDILGAGGAAAVRARSGWLIIDVDKRRPLRPQSVMDKLPLNEGLDALTTGPVSLSERDNLKKTGERKALYTDVDYNGHVNNVRYIQWTEDALDPQLLERAGKVRLDINYMNEILSGDITEIWSAPLENEAGAGENGTPNAAYAIDGRNTTSGQTAFRVELRLWD